MKRYEEYSIAANLLTNEIPSHWTMMRNRVFLRPKFVPVGQDANKYPLLSLTTKGIVFRDIESGKGKFPKDFDTYQVVEPNDIVFCLFDVDETPRTVGLSLLNGMLTGAYDTFSMSNIVSPKFINYYYTAVDDVKALRPYYSGLRKVVKKDKFMAIPIPLPPIPEQNKIVAYLDKRITLIENCKCQRERELQTLNELKQAEIASVVTRGLNPDVPMKDSGIPWIGQIPEHWGIRRAKSMFKKEKREVRPTDRVITCFRDGQVTLRENRRTTGFTESITEIGYQGIRKGDLVIHQMDAFAGSIGVSDSDGKGTSVYHCCTPKGPYIPQYYALVLREMARTGFIQSLYRGIRERSSDFNFQTFGKQYLPIPPEEEQKEIVNFIHTRINKIDTMIEALKAEIDRLTEYKQRLISDVVTGQIDVRGEQI